MTTLTNEKKNCYNIFTNDIEVIDSSSNGIFFSDISDHLPVVHVRNFETRAETIQIMSMFSKEILMIRTHNHLLTQ